MITSIGGMDDAVGCSKVGPGADGVEYLHGHDLAAPAYPGDVQGVVGDGGGHAGAEGAVAVVVTGVAVVIDEVVAWDELAR